MRKKIVHYMSTLKEGGAQTQLILLCNNSNFSEFDVSIVCWNRESSLKIRDEVNVVVLNRGNKSDILGLYRQIKSITQKLSPDVAHLWLPEVLTLPAAIICKNLNIPIINSERRLPVTKLGKLWFRDHIEYIIHLYADKIVTNFPLPIKRKSVFNLIMKKKGITIYNGLDLEALTKYRNAHDLSLTNGLKLVYCGRLVTQKNIDILIKAISILIQAKVNVTLDIYGTGEREQDVINLINSHKLNNVVFLHGYQDNWKEKAAKSDCFILPSSREGMPNVLFEATAIGLPVIATDIEEISIHFTNQFDAILVAPKSVSGITDAVNQIIQNPSILEKILSNATETVKKYTVSSMVKSYENLYVSLLPK